MTSTDAKATSDLISRLKGLINSAEFDQAFATLTASLPKSKQFLLKMELKRLAQPCNYFIDLRGHVEGDVKPYVHLEKTHFLDEHARKIFETGLQSYGQYTVGIYEDIMNADNNYRVRHRRETDSHITHALDNLRKGLPVQDEQNAEKEPEPESSNRLVQFGHYIKRLEERMNFGIEVHVRFADERFAAITSDLSVCGCKLKTLAGKNIHVGEQLNLTLTGLEKEYALDLPNGLNYQVLDIELQGKYAYYRLQRLDPEQEPLFNQFLKNFIQGNKRRYKVNLDNVIDAFTTKGYEQFYIPRISGLPVYVQYTDIEGFAAKFCLTSDYNKALWHYFLDEHQRSVLNLFLTPARIKSLQQQSNTEKSTILYSFTHAAKGKLYFYLATAEELAAEPALKSMFFGFGSGKPSWRVIHINLLNTQTSNSVDDFELPGIKHKTPSPLIQSMLQHVQHIVVLTDISTTWQPSEYRHYSYNNANLAALNKFGLSKAITPALCEAIPIHYVNLRAEPRYLYKTTALLHSATDQTIITTASRDFSVGGIQLEATIPVDFKKGDVLLLDLPDLQKLTPKYQLTNLPYEVMAVSKNRHIMNLKAVKTNTPHIGKQFFQQIIHSNRSKLTVAEEAPKYPGLSDALRNMYIKAFNSFAIFVHRTGLRHNINVLARGAQPNTLHTLVQLAQTQTDTLDFTLLTKQQLLLQEAANQLKKMKRHDAPVPVELYIRVSELADGQLAFLSMYDFEFSSAQEQKQFVQSSMQQHALFSFRLYLSRTGDIDAEYIAQEMSYISIYAIHKAKLLEQELWQVEGVADGVETSAGLHNRFNLTGSEQQHVARQAILQRAALL